jgi:hypothetical protein
LLKPDMTAGEYVQALEKNKLPMDQVNFMANGLPPKDAVCWACQSSRATAPKLSPGEMKSLTATEAWLKNPTADSLGSVQASLGGVDLTGPAGWAAQAAAWSQAPPVPGVNLTAAAVAGAILLAAGLSGSPAMPQAPKPKLEVPKGPLSPELLAQLQVQQPQANVQIPQLDQSKLVKPLAPFLDLGKGVANGSVSCT